MNADRIHRLLIMVDVVDRVDRGLQSAIRGLNSLRAAAVSTGSTVSEAMGRMRERFMASMTAMRNDAANAFRSIAERAKEGMQRMQEAVREGSQNVRSALDQMTGGGLSVSGSGLGNFLGGATRTVGHTLSLAIRGVSEFAGSLMRTLTPAVVGVIRVVTDLGGSLLRDLLGSLPSVLGGVFRFAGGIAETLGGALAKTIGWVGDLAGKLVSGLGAALSKVAGWAADAAGALASVLGAALEKVIGLASRAALVVGGLLVAGFTAVAKEGVDMNITLEGATRGLTRITGSAAGAAKFLKDLQDDAQVSALTFKELIPVGQALASSFKEAYGPAGIARAIPAMKAFRDAAAGVGADSDAVKRALLGFRQLMGREFASQEDINQISENMPGTGVAGILKRAFGIADTESLKRAGVTAKQVSEAIVKGFQAGFGGMEEAARKSIPTALGNIADAFNFVSGKVTQGLKNSLERGLDTVLTLLGRISGNQQVLDALAVPFNLAGRVIELASVQLERFVGWLERTANASAVEDFFINLAAAGKTAWDVLSRFAGFVWDKIMPKGGGKSGPFDWLAAANAGFHMLADAVDRVVAFVFGLMRVWDEAKKMVSEWAKAAGEFLARAKEAVGNFIGSASTLFANFTDTVATYWDYLGDRAESAFMSLRHGFRTLMADLKEMLLPFQEAWSGTLQAISFLPGMGGRAAAAQGAVTATRASVGTDRAAIARERADMDRALGESARRMEGLQGRIEARNRAYTEGEKTRSETRHREETAARAGFNFADLPIVKRFFAAFQGTRPEDRGPGAEQAIRARIQEALFDFAHGLFEAFQQNKIDMARALFGAPPRGKQGPYPEYPTLPGGGRVTGTVAASLQQAFAQTGNFQGLFAAATGRSANRPATPEEQARYNPTPPPVGVALQAQKAMQQMFSLAENLKGLTAVSGMMKAKFDAGLGTQEEVVNALKQQRDATLASAQLEQGTMEERAKSWEEYFQSVKGLTDAMKAGQDRALKLLGGRSGILESFIGLFPKGDQPGLNQQLLVPALTRQRNMLASAATTEQDPERRQDLLSQLLGAATKFQGLTTDAFGGRFGGGQNRGLSFLYGNDPKQAQLLNRLITDYTTDTQMDPQRMTADNTRRAADLLQEIRDRTVLSTGQGVNPGPLGNRAYGSVSVSPAGGVGPPVTYNITIQSTGVEDLRRAVMGIIGDAQQRSTGQSTRPRY